MAVDTRGWAAGCMAALILAAPARADDAAMLEACLSNASWDMRRDCIGVISAPCQEAPGGASTLGIVECLGREHQAWDALLNRWWPGMKADAEATDASNREHGIDVANAAETLLTAQRAWLNYRDAECAFRWLPYAGGTIRGPIAASCMMEMTAERAIDFYAHLNN